MAHIGLANANTNSLDNLTLNSTAAVVTGFGAVGNLTSVDFDVRLTPTTAPDGYVAYIFADDAESGGFIRCGSYIGNGSVTGPAVTLGWEPQWLLIKNASGTGSWQMMDNIRGMSVGLADATLQANQLNAESSVDYVSPTATGFRVTSASSEVNTNTNRYIYIAIRRGPMRIPISGTSVFQPTVYTGTNVDNRLVNTTISPDMVWVRQRNDSVLSGMVVGDRLRGQPYLLTGSTAAEVNDANAFDQQLVSAVEYGTAFSAMNGFWCGNDATAKLNANTTANNHVVEAFRRASGFFDVVGYIGNGTTQTITHSLGVAPEMIIAKASSSANEDWEVTHTGLPGGIGTASIQLNRNFVVSPGTGRWGSFTPTATQFRVDYGAALNLNTNNVNYVAYLFASVTGVSRVGSYTGTGNTQQIDCGFTSGARFVLIKRTDSTGDWFVWDTARGIVSLENEVIFTTPGTYTWTVPAGVTSISVVCVGGGGGGGGSGGGVSVTAGATSFFNNTSTVAAGGGGAGLQTSTPGTQGGVGGTVIAGTGTNGARAPALVNSFNAAGGGGAGLLSGSTGTNGAENSWGGGGGFGADLYSNAQITGGSSHSDSSSKGGRGGGFGGGGGGGRDGVGGGGGAIAYINNFAVSAGQTYTVTVGAGGTGQNAAVAGQRGGGNGGNGAVRIVWSGVSRQFPSTNITAQGGLDPYLLTSSTAAEVTNTSFVNPWSAGFEIGSAAPATINATGGNFIFLAIA